jgi:putative hemolysin
MHEWALIVAGVLFAAFHSGSETGTYCVNRLRLRLRAEQGLASARALLDFTRRPRLAISTILIGTNVGVYVATVLSAQKLNDLLAGVHAELYSGLIMPPILLICADFFPKSLFQHHADALMYRAIWPLRVSQRIFYPLALLLRWLGGLPQMLLGRGTAPPVRQFSRDAFRYYLSQGAAHGVLSSFQRTVADNVLRLKSLEVGRAMTPLSKVVMVPEDAPAGRVREVFAAHRYSRIPVYRGAREQIVGVRRVMDLALGNGRPTLGDEQSREVLNVRRGASVADVLWTLRQARQQLAVVTDHEGRAVGVVTVKDLLEEIVGELEGW